MIRKVLVANRGEIAVRIIRACREMEIETVAVYSEADRDALHAKLADEAVCIGPARPTDSYLAMEQILSAAVVTGADAIHPGFGFLSENSRFAELCEKCGIIFIGPPAEVIARMGNKQEARNTMQKAGIPIIPGSRDAVYEEEDGLEQAKAIGYPVMIKAALGGGGKGMRVAQSPEEFRKNFRIAQTEAKQSFGDGAMYLEHFLTGPKHVEVQILADRAGNTIYLGERDCSMQRRHQKVLEEAPCATDKPILENPTPDKPTTENPTQLNKDIQKTDLPKKEKSNTDLSNTDSIPILSPNPSPYAGAAATPPERKRTEAAQSAFEIYEEIIKDNISYDVLVQDRQLDRERLDELVDLMLETVCTRRKTIRVAGDDYPAELVKAKFMKLDSEHIRFVLDCMSENTTKIRNIKQYMKAALFNAPSTIGSYYTSLVAHDMASGLLSPKEPEHDPYSFKPGESL